MGSGQKFFKVIWDSEKMEIPPGFVSQMQGSLPKRCVLRDRHEKTWPMKVAREGSNGGWYFRKGWTKFYREKSLQTCDILFFVYRGVDLFDVTVFGGNACEKGEGTRESRVEEEEDNGEEEEEEKDHEWEEMEQNDYDNDEDDDDDDDDDDDYVDDDDDDDDDYVVDDDDDDADDNDDDVHVQGDKQADGSKNIKLPGPQPNTNALGEPETVTSKRKHQKQNLPDCYGVDIFKSGLAIRPENPFFVTRPRTTRKNELYIPKDVIVDYHLNIPGRLFLVDEQGRKWETKIKQWKDGRLWCTRGWRSLCNVNNIGMDDTCICEFVGEQGCNKDMCIHVRVVSGV